MLDIEYSSVNQHSSNQFLIHNLSIMGSTEVTVVLIAICFCSIKGAPPPQQQQNRLGHYPGIRPYFLDVNPDPKTLRMLYVVHRNGDRSMDADESYPKDPNKNIQIGPKGRAQLTAIGKAQTYELGKYLRARYGNAYLNRIYSIEEVVASSMETDRAQSSVQTVLAGLFPPSLDDPEGRWNDNIPWQPIPVKVEGWTVDAVIQEKLMSACPKYSEEYKSVLASEDYKNIDKKYAAFYEYLAQNTGRPIRNVVDAFEIIKILVVQRSHGLRLPSWTEEAGFWVTAKEITRLSFKERFTSATQIRLRSGPIISRIIDSMKQKRNETENPDGVRNPLAKLLLISGHAETVVGLLTGLGMSDWDEPQYASAVMIELHKEDRSPNQASFENPHTDPYYIQVFYRKSSSEPCKELKIPGCGSPCRLDEFERIATPIRITRPEWETECLAGQGSSGPISVGSPPFTFIPGYG